MSCEAKIDSSLFLIKLRESTVAHQHLQVNTHLDELAQVLNWFSRHYQAKLPQVIFLQCQTLLAEAFTNAVRHAHRGKPSETPIDIEVRSTLTEIEIRVWDFGPEFSFEHHLRKSLQRIDPEAVGGRGLPLIKQLSDSVSYQRAQHRNCLQMVKKQDSPQ